MRLCRAAMIQPNVCFAIHRLEFGQGQLRDEAGTQTPAQQFKGCVEWHEMYHCLYEDWQPANGKALTGPMSCFLFEQIGQCGPSSHLL